MLFVEANDRVAINAAPPWSVYFDSFGFVALYSEKNVTRIAWIDILDLRLVGPARLGPAWPAMQAILELLAPVSLKSKGIRVEIETNRGGWEFFEYPAGARSHSGLNDGSAERLADELAGRRQLQMLGDAGYVANLIGRVAGLHGRKGRMAISQYVSDKP